MKDEKEIYYPRAESAAEDPAKRVAERRAGRLYKKRKDNIGKYKADIR